MSRNMFDNQSLITAIERAGSVIRSLNALGVSVKGVMLHGGEPVIRVYPCAYCDRLIHAGKAVYVQFGCGTHGAFRQGTFRQSGCKVVWSESLQ